MSVLDLRPITIDKLDKMSTKELRDLFESISTNDLKELSTEEFEILNYKDFEEDKKRVTLHYERFCRDCRKNVWSNCYKTCLYKGCKVKPLMRLKDKSSVWPKGFSNKFYKVIGRDKLDGKEVLVLKTGKEEYEYQVVYPSEVVKV